MYDEGNIRAELYRLASAIGLKEPLLTASFTKTPLGDLRDSLIIHIGPTMACGSISEILDAVGAADSLDNLIEILKQRGYVRPD
jgi:hypothetical protein